MNVKLEIKPNQIIYKKEIVDNDGSETTIEQTNG